jgi:hypothetical protein
MTFAHWLMIGLALFALWTSGLSWWCKTLWNRVDELGKANNALERECVDRDAKLWAALHNMRTHAAETYVVKDEMHTMTDRMMARFDRLEAKIDAVAAHERGH